MRQPRFRIMEILKCTKHDLNSGKQVYCPLCLKHNHGNSLLNLPCVINAETTQNKYNSSDKLIIKQSYVEATVKLFHCFLFWFLFACLLGTKDWTQGLIHARQASTTSSTFPATLFVNWGKRKNICPVEVPSPIPFPQSDYDSQPVTPTPGNL
jgi:hypothetical protein